MIFTVFVTVPQWGTYTEANQKYAEAMQLEVERQTFLDNLDARLQDMQKYDKEVKELSLALPDKFMQGNIWVNIENMASSAGVTIDNIGEAKKIAKSTPASAVPDNTMAGAAGNGNTEAAVGSVVDSKLEGWDTGITLKGNYSQIRNFVKNLEDSLILSDLRDISITQSASADKSQPSDVLAVSMVVRTYTQP